MPRIPNPKTHFQIRFFLPILGVFWRIESKWAASPFWVLLSPRKASTFRLGRKREKHQSMLKAKTEPDA